MSFVKKATVIYYKISEDRLKVALNNTVNCCQHPLFLWLYCISIVP